MKKFKVYLTYDGYMTVEVEAKNEEEAAERAMEGDYDPATEDDNQENFEIENVEEVK